MLKRTSIVILLIALSFVSFGFTKNAQALTLTPVRLELSGDAGNTVTSEITLINDRDTEETFYSSYANFEAQGETGSPNFVDPVEGLGTWIKTDEVVVLAPGTSKIIPVTITIPSNTEPGGYFAAVFFGTNNPNLGDAGSVSIGAKTGVLVLLRVNGEVSEQGGILEYDTKDHKRFFTSLPVDFYYRFQNTGGDRVKPEGDITVKHFLGFVRARIPANLVEGNVLPNQIRRFEASWQSKNGTSVSSDEKLNFIESVKNQWFNFAFGYYKANISLVYGEAEKITESSVGVWVFPWQLLLTIIVVLFIVRFIWKRVSIHRRKELMSEMREEIMKEMNNKTNTEKTHIQF